MITYSEFHKEAIEKVKHLWHVYIIADDPKELARVIDKVPERFLVIGTGRHEFYKNRKAFIDGITADQVEARDINFELLDEWYEVREISQDVCVVYGSIWAREKPVSGKPVLVDMEGSRFTAVCRNTDQGAEICSIHHSMPYMDQGEDEYYPKSLASLANEAVKKSRVLERRVEMDHMTELYNRIYMEKHISQAIKKESGYYWVIDLDDFKSVNDLHGHLAGDEVIRRFAGLLRECFSTSAILGRMGGDEFAVWDHAVRNPAEAKERYSILKNGCQRITEQLNIPVSCSAGIAMSRRTGEDFTELYQRADSALYQAKAKGKECLSWAD